jgi:two-component system response regulator AtoC
MIQHFVPGAIADSEPSSCPLFFPGVSAAMRALERTIADIAPTDIPVLLVGESGTGKEVVALEIHRLSRHWNEPFIKWGCAGLSSDSLASQLHAGGVPRGGTTQNSFGSLYLDEISLLDLPSQSRLLHMLPANSVMASANSLNARVISSTTRNLDEEMRGGRFHEALFYRINGVFLRLPPLRHRKDDIPPLLDFFLKKYSALFGRSEPKLTPETLDLLMGHDWPGNVRELENAARKMVALGSVQLMPHDFAAYEPISAEGGIPAAPSRTRQTKGQSLKEPTREASQAAERELILKHLERTHWNRKRTARDLQISYKALLYKLKQLGLEGDDTFDEL